MRIALPVVLGFCLLVLPIRPNAGVQLAGDAADRCFCRLQGEVDDCSCKVENVDSFNNQRICPLLESLLVKDYFKYFKAVLDRSCEFWVADTRCTMKACGVDPCTTENLPKGLVSEENTSEKNPDHEKNKYAEAREDSECDGEEKSHGLGNLDTSLSEETIASFEKWTKHDDKEVSFCVMEDETSQGARYYDLMLNPEGYTAYKGESAWKIWRSIYNENCFKPGEDSTQMQELESYLKGLQDGMAGMCLEKRVFYRAVSGLHSSINIHLSARYLQDEPAFIGSIGRSSGPPHFEHNVDEFQRRFDSSTTNGKGPQWLKNLYFVYLIELRAMAKAAPYLRQLSYFTGSEKNDKDTQAAVKTFLDAVSSFKNHFDESKLFQGEALQLKEEFRQKFLNISRIMDCVGCEKCRLWGKLQITGLGTALKILFSGKDTSSGALLTPENLGNFSLKRTEVVALFNAFGRLSTSIREVERFRKLMQTKKKATPP